MTSKDAELLRRLLETFKIEAEEHIQAMSSGLLELERAEDPERQAAIVEVVFREAHSLKGAARAVNLESIESACQALESVFSALKRQVVVPSPQMLDRLHEAVDGLDRLLIVDESELATAEKTKLADLFRQLETLARPEVASAEPAPPKPAEPAQAPEVREVREQLPASEERPAQAETVRVSAARLDSLLLQVEELLGAKLAAEQRAAELRQISGAVSAWENEWAKLPQVMRALRPAGETNGALNGRAKSEAHWTHLAEFIDRSQTLIESLESRLGAAAWAAERDYHALSGMVDTLLVDMKQALIMPFASLLEIFPRLVRDLSREQGKEVDLTLRGGEIEIDRRILQELKDPLIHLVRNCLDHGIEKPETRAALNKPARGTVQLIVTRRDGNKVELEVSDDGAGINAAQVRAATARLGLASPESTDALSEVEAMALVFQSGVSTSPLITDISGRGLGLAIVREKVEKIGGTVSVASAPNVGTTFRILLPLTLATFRGILVRVSEHLFVLPTASVDRVARVSQADIQSVENRETIRFDGRPMAFVRLGDVLELPRRNASKGSSDHAPVVVLRSADLHIAFQVDEILGEQEVLVKQLGPQLVRVRNVAGATVLGTGQVVPNLHVADLMKSAVRAAAAPAAAAAAPAAPAKRQSVLVAEDSITSRALLKNILEAAGYNVQTAVDGMDAFTKLRTGDFDIVISDVDMPRMSGFDLTAKIRGDKKLAEVPVVLVTSLESRQDRERGVDVGANGYLIKSSFDQSNLLDAIRRLIG